MTPFASAVSDVLLLLLVAIIVAIGASAARIPYVVGLVLAGLAIGLAPHHPAIGLTPDLVMLVFLPPLLFAGAWSLPIDELRHNWLPIALFATVGVAVGIAISYAVLVYAAGIDPRAALIFGTVVAATDPTAVLALFRQLRTNRRLATIVEGESLFNDGTAVIAFRTLLVTAAGSAGALSLHPAAALGQFALLTAGGAATGAAIGLLAGIALKATNDPVVEAAVTTIVAYGSYMVAEAARGSGIVAVITAGLILSNVGRALGSFSDARVWLTRFWEYVAFIANSLLFVLVGLSINLPALASAGVASAWGIAAVVAARAGVIYGLAPLSGVAGARLPRTWQHIVALGGLRGALSIALVLSLPEDFQHRGEIVAMVYSVVLFTLVVQGLALRPVMRAGAVTTERDPFV